MRKPTLVSTTVRPKKAWAAVGCGPATITRLSEEDSAALAACALIPHHHLTRGELALVFEKCPRTISRRERELNLPINRRNQRVLRYSMEVVVLLCAMGWEMDRTQAERLNLVPDVILTLAAKHALVLGRKPAPEAEPSNPVLLGSSEDERALIRAWNDSTKGPLLRQMIRLMSA